MRSNYELGAPQITTPEDVAHRSGYKAFQAPRPPPWAGVDRDLSRRPGVPWQHEPRLMKNARLDIPPMQTPPSAFKHGRPNKPMPPVYGTAEPPHGLSGFVRGLAAKFPDHKPEHWMLKLLGDRVDSWTYHAQKYAPFAVPLLAAGVIGGLRARKSRTEARVRRFDVRVH